ncbi:glycoside hydrolase family 5 protein [Hydnum rufescens UP504]|uniref:Glycoside hydrolase family 5 protein n=1 Tax=Hydnum rufescens UP504 TaxID=1448309 RepID=A0A9P6AU80_9AGAM|nr:glycoside hydrolase family 5 protein [Hydnum rufescens UP504]
MWTSVLFLLVISCITLSSPLSGNHSPNIEARVAPHFPYGSSPVRGVSLGGWLVLEPWITPSLFDNTGKPAIVDDVRPAPRPGNCLRVLKNHWGTFITEADFATIAAAGLNHIGFWAFDTTGGERYITGQFPYLRTAVTWAQNHGLFVLIDLHGAPGSQNGYDDSGHRGSISWNIDQTNIDRMNAIIKALAAEFSKPQYANVVSAIAPLNEPAAYTSLWLLSTYRQFVYDSYGNICQNGNLVEVMHDAFQPLDSWNRIMSSSSGYTNVLMGTHHYQVFSNAEEVMTWPQHISTACDCGVAMVMWASTSGNLWTIAGEFTTTPYDCVKYLNGCGLGCATIAFEKAQGWIYWTWKMRLALLFTESTDEWSYQKGLAGGWILQDPTDPQYPNICG